MAQFFHNQEIAVSRSDIVPFQPRAISRTSRLNRTVSPSQFYPIVFKHLPNTVQFSLRNEGKYTDLDLWVLVYCNLNFRCIIFRTN